MSPDPKQTRLFYFLVTALIITIIGSVFSVNRNLVGSYSAPKYYALILGACFAFILFIISKNNEKHIDFSEVTIITIYLFLNFLTSVLSNCNISFGVHKIDLMYEGLLICLYIVTRYLVCRNLISFENIMYGFFVLVTGVGIFQSILGIFQYIMLDLINPEILPVKTVLNGTIGPSNGYGLLIGLSLFSMVYVYNENSRKISKFWLIMSLIVLSLAFFLNKCRGAWISLCVSLILLLMILKSRSIIRFIENKSSASKLKKQLLSIFFLLLSIVSFSLSLKAILNINFNSVTGRLYSWQISREMFKNNMLSGVGYGRFAPEFLNYQMKFLSNPSNQHFISKASDLATPHSQYLLEFCEKGLIGGLLFLTLFAVIVYHCIKYLRSNSQPYKIQISYLMCFIMIILLHCLIDSSLVVIPIRILFVISLAFIPVLALSNAKMRFNNHIFLTGFMFCTIIVYAAFKVVRNDYLGRQAWHKANCYFNQYQYEQASIFYTIALKYRPNDPALICHYGISLIGLKEYECGINRIRSALDDYNEKSAWLALSLAELRIRRPDAAEEYAMIVHRMFPDQLRPLLMLGVIDLYTGEVCKAEEKIRKCANQETSVQSPITAYIADRSRRIYDSLFGHSLPPSTLYTAESFDSTFGSTIDSIMLVVW